MGIRKKFEDWMTIITYAEAGVPEMGFDITGGKATGDSKFALDKIRVVRSDEASPETTLVEDQVIKTQETRTAASKEKLEIMILDDEPIVGKRLKPALTKSGFDVEVFENPAKALSRFDEKNFDIVVTDLRMEEIDGIQVLEHIMSKSRRNTKVIFITGYATVEVAREALVKGAFDFIAKPFKLNDLRMAVNKAALALGHRGLLQAGA